MTLEVSQESQIWVSCFCNIRILPSDSSGGFSVCCRVSVKKGIRGCWEAAFQIVCLTGSAHFVSAAQIPVIGKRWTLGLCVCVCQDSLLWLQTWLLPHSQRINVSFGYIQPSFGGPWAQGMFVRYTRHVLLTVSAGTQTRVYAMHGVRCYLCAARGSGSQGSWSPRFPEKLLRVQGFWKAACFEGFPVLEGADSSWSGCCLPNTFCS